MKHILCIYFFLILPFFAGAQSILKDFQKPVSESQIEQDQPVTNYPVFCQPFTVQINPLQSSHAIIDTIFINVCPGDTINLSAIGIFPNSGYIYEQTQENTKFIWQFSDSYKDTGATISKVIESQLGLEMVMYGIDTNGCFSSNMIKIKIRVSNSPIVSVNSPYLGFSGVFNAVSVGYDSTSTIIIDTIHMESLQLPVGMTINIDTVFLPDGNNISYPFPLLINAYSYDQVIESLDDIQSIKLNIEHSFIGDLSITLTCPNGARSILKQQSNNIPTPTGPVNLLCSTLGSNLMLGSAEDTSTPSDNCFLRPGIGWDYEFRPYATNCFGTGAPTVNYSYVNVCSYQNSGVSLIPSIPNSYTATPTTPVYYGTYESLSNLIGCPLNGAWILTITDHWSVDNGYIFNWGIQFSDSITPNPWSYSVVLDHAEWYGNNITSTGPYSAEIYEPNIGVYTYGAMVYDEYGCAYDTTFNFYCFLKVEDLDHQDKPVHFFPNPVTSDLNYTILNDLWEHATVSLYSVAGTLVYQNTLSDHHNNFDLSFLSSGSYILKVKNNTGEEYSVKIIVKKS